MGLIKYDKQNFLASLEPGIVTLVVSAFEKKLADKLDGIVKETYEELKKELPQVIDAKVRDVFNYAEGTDKITVEVELRETPELKR